MLAFDRGLQLATTKPSKKSTAGAVLHMDTLHHPDFAELPDEAKFHALAIAALISHYGGAIPLNAAWIEREIHAATPIDIDLLIRTGLLQPFSLSPEQQAVFAELPSGKGYEKTLKQARRQNKLTITDQQADLPLTDHDNQPSDANAPSADIQRVFEHWKAVHRKNAAGVKLTPAMRSKIAARMDEGFTADELCQAVTGCALSPFHMGLGNSDGVKYDTIELIFRNGEKTRSFIARTQAHQNCGKEAKPINELETQVHTVFAAWQRYHASEHNAGHILTGEAKRLIIERIQEGFSTEQLCMAAEGFATSEWHMGNNGEAARNTITHLFGSGERVRSGLQLLAEAKPESNELQSQSITGHDSFDDLLALLTSTQPTGSTCH